VGDKKFDEAKLLYDLQTKSDINSLEELIPFLGLSNQPQELIKRVDRLKKGMPAEDEFIALAIWMGKCKLIHKLEQEQFPKVSSEKYQVPDLLGVFDYKGKEIPVLIDVKVSEKEMLPYAKFRLTASKYEKMTSYANLLGLPLLIAWKISGYWTLFDIGEMQIHESAYHIDSAGAMKADLMYLLLDSVHIIPMPHVSFTFVFKDLDIAVKKAESVEVHNMKIKAIHFTGYDSKPITKMSMPQFILWLFAEHEEKQRRNGNLFEVTFEVPENALGLPAFALLPLILFQTSTQENRPKNWYEVIKNENYGNITYNQFKKAMQDGLGVFIQDILKIVPHKHPDFIPPMQKEEEV
jgi:Holliday junction resolvase